MPKSKFSDHTPEEWIEIWNDDKRSVVATMYRNLTADIEAKYSPWGHSVRQSQAQITTYIAEWEEQEMKIERLDNIKAKGFMCYRWLKKSGAIE